MNSLPPGLPIQAYNEPVNSRQPLTALNSQTQSHPNALSLANLSRNTHYALDQAEVQPNGHYKLMALLVRHGIADGAVQLQSANGADAHYRHQINVLPENDVAHLTIRARLDEQAQYDITGIDLHVPSSGRAESMTLNVLPPPATLHEPASSPNTSSQSPSRTHLALFTNSALVQELIHRNNPQDFSDKPLPSGASVGTQSMVFSHGGSTGASTDALGRQRTVPDHAARRMPYATSAQSDASSLRGHKTRVQDPEHPDKTVLKSTLNKREQGRKRVVDPENPGKTVAQGALKKRKYDREMVVDPTNLEKTVTVNALKKRQRVQDPNNPGQTIDRGKLSLQKHRQQRVQDPLDSSRTMTQSALANRQARARKAAEPSGTTNE
jgi:hypothetical protein